MHTFITFIAGVFIGGLISFFTVALLNIAGDENNENN